MQAPPYLFPGDKSLNSVSCNAWTSKHRSLDEYVASPEFGRPSDKSLHLGLLPQPYCGNLHNASVFVLMSSPGLSPSDYFGEQTVKAFRTALVRNLRQQNADDDYPFLFLDPQFAWHSGFTYWHDKLWRIAEKLGKQAGVSYREALKRLSKQLAVLQSVPYHCRSLGLPRKVLCGLASSQAAVEYVHQVLVPKVQDDEVVIVAARANYQWNLQELDGIIVYEGHDCLHANLGPKSRGGEAIAARLGLE